MGGAAGRSTGCSAGNPIVRQACLLGVGLLCACTVGPDYVRPGVEAPAAYKEQGTAMQTWKLARPADGTSRGKWWEIFNDPELNALEEQVNISNQNLIAAEAQFRQARALVRFARAGYFPTATGGASVIRSRQSATLGQRPVAQGPLTDYTLPLDLSWELDVWGRVRRTVEANEASAQASAADLEAVRLALQAELVSDYFELRGLDAERQLLENTISAYQRALEVTTNRYNAGVVSKADVAQAETQLKMTQAQAIDLGVQRAQLEHAIALLVNKPPSEFSLRLAPLTAVPPPVPVGVPSALLERRPDIAAAERLVAAANAQIGVAEAAYFPTITLSAAAGFETTRLADWFIWPSRFWSLGSTVAATLFDGGARKALSDQAVAAYDQTVATYRGTVLTAFQEVEDNLAALRILAEEAGVQEGAVKAAQHSVELTKNRYLAGVVSYLDVVTAQTVALSNQRSAVDIARRRMTASVLLVKALGGGWSAADLR